MSDTDVDLEETGVQSGEESIGGDQSQNSMGHLARLLGRPKSFSGREDEWHDWSLKFGATAATLSEHASLWMSDALRTRKLSWINRTRDRPRSLRDSCTLCLFTCVRDEHWHLSGEHQTITVWKRGGCCTNGINRRRGREAWRC